MTSSDDCINFGLLVMEKGYIAECQLGRAISQRMVADLKTLPHRRLGEILVAMGFIREIEIKYT